MPQDIGEDTISFQYILCAFILVSPLFFSRVTTLLINE